MNLLGLDIGSSSIKAALIDATSGHCLATATSPDTELPILSEQPGFAEQHPDTWWEHIEHCIRILKGKVPGGIKQVKAIGISYQMHGLVCVDVNGQVLRPAIIWCDSRAVTYGEAANEALGQQFCLEHYLNSPGNFTAAKLKWVKENEPELFAKIHKVMLPGDYIAYKLTGKLSTSISGLSEGIFWDFKHETTAHDLLKNLEIDGALLPEYHDSFGLHGQVLPNIALELGLPTDAVVSYRAGDQPNNALALNVLNPGEVAANAGTSGVIYGVTAKPLYDQQSRVNTFVHVNHTKNQSRYGVLACINGTGILNSWVRKTLSTGLAEPISYPTMNELAAEAPVGSDGLLMLPFGNGAERTLNNQNPGAQVIGLDLNRHSASHFARAAQEGIVCALNYGLDIMRQMGMEINTVRAGHANMFLSPIFAQTFADVTGAVVELYEADGAQGAARAAGVGAGLIDEVDLARGLTHRSTITPQANREYAHTLYANWLGALHKAIN